MADWWESFFEGLWERGQLGAGSEQDSGPEADTVERALRLQSGARVLDAPCGDGRISVELACRGYSLTGVDLNETFLTAAARKAHDRGVRVDWLRQDMRTLPFDSEFDAVVNFGGSFGYFDDRDDARTAAAAHRALRPAGRLLIDAPSAETVFPQFREQVESTMGGLLVLRENRYDLESGRIETEWTIEAPDGARERRHSSVRLYTYHELAGLLAGAGFTKVEGFDAEDLGTFRIGSSRLIVVATK